ncbi:MAG: RidA family protein [Chloroflexi bacterium]|nr:RidA family protein [Chloroflexota bacterium]
MRRAIEAADFPLPYKRYSFTLGLETPEGVWLSGHSASRLDPARGEIVAEGDIVAQSRTAYDKIAMILAAAGLGFRDVVRTVDYVTADGIEDYPRTAALRRELFGDSPPVTNTVVVKRLLRPTALIEVEVFASRRGSQLVQVDPAIDGLHRAQARRVGDVVYVAAQLPFRPGASEIVAPGDIGAQTRQIYENAGRILHAAGLGWESVVKTVEFLPPAGLAGYKDTGRVRREFLGPRYPVATGIIMPRLAHPDALLQVDFVASHQPKEIANPGWTRYEKLTYAPGLKAGKMLFLAGQGSLNPETHGVEHEGDIVAQTRYVYENIVRVVRAAGGGAESLVKTIEFVTPAALPRYRETAAVRKELFPEPYPAATGIVCEALLRPEMLIEVDAWAVLP